MKKQTPQILPATARERRLIEKLTATPALERLDKGELELVEDEDWSDVPPLAEDSTLHVPMRVYRSLKAASQKRHTTPDQLATRILSRELKEA